MFIAQKLFINFPWLFFFFLLSLFIKVASLDLNGDGRIDRLEAEAAAAAAVSNLKFHPSFLNRYFYLSNFKSEIK